MKIAPGKLLAFLTIFHFISVSPAFPDMRVWVDHGSVKIRQQKEAVGTRTNLNIECAKNEFEPFQIFVFADNEDLKNVDVSVTPFTNSEGNIIEDIYIYKQHYLNISRVSRGDYQSGLWPDALLPKVDRYFQETRNTFPFSVKRGNVQGIWVDVGTTEKTPAGKYTAGYRVSADGKPDSGGTITLNVWNFAIPSTSTMPNLWTMETALLDNGHGVPVNHAWIADMKKLYLKAYLYHRMGCSNRDGAIIWVSTNKLGGIVTWKRFMRIYRDALDGTAISSGPYAGATMATDIHGHGLADKSQKRYISYLQQWWDKWKSEGWDPMKNLFLWTWDEPNGSLRTHRGRKVKDYEIILRRAADMNAVDTRGEGTWKNAFTTEPRKPELSDPGKGLISLDKTGFYCPLAVSYEYRPPWQSSKQKVARGSYPGYKDWVHHHHWSYISCMNHACNKSLSPFWNGQMDIALDTPAFYTRIYNWVFWKYKVNGTLYYMTTSAYGREPYKNYWSEGGNGNGMLIYPGVPSRRGRNLPKSTPTIGGAHDIPIESIRMKLFRESMEDFEYMTLLRKSGHEDFVEEQVNTIFTSLKTPPGPYYQLSNDPNKIYTARRRMAQKILESGIKRRVSPLESPSNLRIIQQ